jgi:hypothetical protein
MSITLSRNWWHDTWINHLFSTIVLPDTFHQCPQPFACHGRKRRPLIAVMLRASLACQFQLNVRCAGSTLHPWHQNDQTRHHWCSFISNLDMQLEISNLDMQLERLLSTIQYQCNVVPVCVTFSTSVPSASPPRRSRCCRHSGLLVSRAETS